MKCAILMQSIINIIIIIIIKLKRKKNKFLKEN